MSRIPDYPINDIFLRRWSPRAMSGQPLAHEVLLQLFEAARWAPSSGNSQPWRFIYAHRDTSHWDTLFNLLAPGNQRWAHRGAVLCVILSARWSDEGRPLPTHSFDTGAAWENISLQAAFMNLVMHGLAGFDYERACDELQVSERYAVEAMFVVGHPSSCSILPEDLQARETPSGRKSIGECIAEGTARSLE